MILQTTIKDCLFLNWALPLRELPPPPEPLRYQVHEWEGDRYVFANALLFRQERLRAAGLPFLRFTHPQFGLRLCTLDEGGPSSLFSTIVVSSWILPAARIIAGLPATQGYFQYPSIEAGINGDAFRWSVRRRRRLALSAIPGEQAIGHGPSLGDWKSTVDYFWHRPRGYVVTSRGLDEIAATQRPADVTPMKVELVDTGLLQKAQPMGDDTIWSRLHSAWLCPSIRFVFELAPYRHATLPHQVAAPS